MKVISAGLSSGFADQLGVALAELGGGRVAPGVVVFHGAPAPVADAMADTSSSGVIEVSDEEDVAAVLDEARWGRATGAWFASVRSASCLDFDFPDIVAQGALGQLGIAEELGERRLQDISTALREILVNAAVHGNMELPSPEKTSEGLKAFHSSVNARASELPYAARRVRVTATLRPDAVTFAVIDEGPGYTPSSSDKSGDGYTGRGLDIVRALVGEMRVADGGRRTELSFRRRVEPRSRDTSPDSPAGDVVARLHGSVFDCPILIVDDEEILVEMTAFQLQDAGFKRIDTASNGSDAWAKINADNPDFVILDHSMPDMTGLDVIAKVREQEKTRELPVLLVSAHEDRAFRADALRAGATNVMTKPVDPDLLIHRTRQLLEKLLAVRQLRAYQRRVTVELRQAQRMQEELMPSHDAMAAVSEATGIQLSARFQMSSELGGDWWGLSDFGDGLFGLYMVDFSGHGVGPAINTFRLHTLMRDNPPPLDGPGGYLTRLNSRICSILPRGQYATMLYGIFDVAERRFTYAATGCPPIIFGKADGTILAAGETSGVPLGLSRKSTFEDRVIDIPEAGFMLLYSDALLECPSPGGDMLGDDGLMKLVRSVLEEPGAEPPLDRLVDRFTARTRLPLDDDLTAVWLGL